MYRCEFRGWEVFGNQLRLGLCLSTRMRCSYSLLFSFIPVQGGDGTYDSRGGYDYHLPVEDSAVKEPSLYVTHISVEMAPIAKVWE